MQRKKSCGQEKVQVIPKIHIFWSPQNLNTYSNLPNNRVGPFNRVGGRFPKN